MFHQFERVFDQCVARWGLRVVFCKLDGQSDLAFKDGFCLATFGVFDFAVIQLYIFAGVVLGLVQLESCQRNARTMLKAFV